jgi:hypothetical protein
MISGNDLSANYHISFVGTTDLLFDQRTVSLNDKKTEEIALQTTNT